MFKTHTTAGHFLVLFSNFSCGNKKYCIDATIHISQEIECVPYAQFYFTELPGLPNKPIQVLLFWLLCNLLNYSVALVFNKVATSCNILVITLQEKYLEFFFSSQKMYFNI